MTCQGLSLDLRHAALGLLAPALASGCDLPKSSNSRWGRCHPRPAL